jgi:hypothetical protein
MNASVVCVATVAYDNACGRRLNQQLTRRVETGVFIDGFFGFTAGLAA